MYSKNHQNIITTKTCNILLALIVFLIIKTLIFPVSAATPNVGTYASCTSPPCTQVNIENYCTDNIEVWISGDPNGRTMNITPICTPFIKKDGSGPACGPINLAQAPIPTPGSDYKNGFKFQFKIQHGNFNLAEFQIGAIIGGKRLDIYDLSNNTGFNIPIMISSNKKQSDKTTPAFPAVCLDKNCPVAFCYGFPSPPPDKCANPCIEPDWSVLPEGIFTITLCPKKNPRLSRITNSPGIMGCQDYAISGISRTDPKCPTTRTTSASGTDPNNWLDQNAKCIPGYWGTSCPKNTTPGGQCDHCPYWDETTPCTYNQKFKCTLGKCQPTTDPTGKTLSKCQQSCSTYTLPTQPCSTSPIPGFCCTTSNTVCYQSPGEPNCASCPTPSAGGCACPTCTSPSGANPCEPTRTCVRGQCQP